MAVLKIDDSQERVNVLTKRGAFGRIITTWQTSGRLVTSPPRSGETAVVSAPRSLSKIAMPLGIIAQGGSCVQGEITVPLPLRNPATLWHGAVGQGALTTLPLKNGGQRDLRSDSSGLETMLGETLGLGPFDGVENIVMQVTQASEQTCEGWHVAVATNGGGGPHSAGAASGSGGLYPMADTPVEAEPLLLDDDLARQVDVLAAQNVVAIQACSQTQQELHKERLKSTFIEETATGVIA